MLDRFRGHHLAHIGSSGGVADHAGAAADQRDRTVARHLEPFHQAERHKVADMERVGGGVKTNVEGRFTVIDQLLDQFLVRYLRNKAAGFQFFVTGHKNDLLSEIFRGMKKSSAPIDRTEDEMSSKHPCYHLSLPASHDNRPHREPAFSSAVTGIPGIPYWTNRFGKRLQEVFMNPLPRPYTSRTLSVDYEDHYSFFSSPVRWSIAHPAEPVKAFLSKNQQVSRKARPEPRGAAGRDRDQRRQNSSAPPRSFHRQYPGSRRFRYSFSR